MASRAKESLKEVVKRLGDDWEELLGRMHSLAWDQFLSLWMNPLRGIT